MWGTAEVNTLLQTTQPSGGFPPTTIMARRGASPPEKGRAPPWPCGRTPVDPAGPDRYRGGAKPWESHAPPLRGVANG